MKKPLVIVLLSVLAIGSLLFGLQNGPNNSKPSLTTPTKSHQSQTGKNSSQSHASASQKSEDYPLLSSEHWDYIEINQKDYVTLENIKECYRFDTLTQDGPRRLAIISTLPSTPKKCSSMAPNSSSQPPSVSMKKVT